MRTAALILLCLFGTFCVSQNLMTYNKANGLPSNNVYQIISTQEGKLWFATEAGVVSYNGYDFRTFTTEDGLADNENFEVLEVQDQIYALGANGGLSKLSKGQEIFKVERDPLDGFLSELHCEAKLEVSASFGGGLRIVRDGKETILGEKDGLHDNHVNFVWVWGDDIYAITKEGICSIEKDNSVSRIIAFEERIHFARAVLLENEVVFENGTEVLCFNKAEQLNPVHMDVPVSPNIVTKAQLLDGKIFFSSYNGTHIYNYSAGTLHHEKSILQPYITTSICKDYSGGYWASTLKDGLVHIVEPAFDHPLQDQTFGILVVNDLALWGDQNFVLHQYIHGAISQKSLKKNREGPRKIRRIKKIGQNFWIENDGAIARYNDDGIEYYQTGEGVIASYRGGYIIGTTKGAFYIDKDSIYDVSMSNPDGVLIKDRGHLILNGNISRLENRGRDVLIGTENGFYIFNQGLYKSAALPSEKVIDIDANWGYCAVTFAGLGTYLCSSTDTFLLYRNSDQGAPATSAEIGQKEIFIGTGKGFYCYESFPTFSKQPLHMLNNLEVRDIEHYHEQLLVSTENGLYTINLKDIEPSKYTIPLSLIQFEANGQNLGTGGQYSLSYNQNEVRIKVEQFSYSSKRARCYYSINGGRQSKFEEELLLQELAPGDYDIEIVAQDEFMRSDTLSLHVEVLPPWWQTWWFRLTVIFTLLGLVYLFFRIRVLTYNRDVVREILLAFRNLIKKEKYLIVKNIKDGSKVKIPVSHIQFLQASKNYVDIYHGSEKTTVRITLKKLFEELGRLNSKQFIRAHKSYVVNLDRITGAHSEFVKIGEHQVPIGVNFKDEMKSLLSELKKK